jgi:hypothetical protein
VYVPVVVNSCKFGPVAAVVCVVVSGNVAPPEPLIIIVMFYSNA